MLIRYQVEQEDFDMNQDDTVSDNCQYYASDIIHFFNLNKEGFKEALAKAESALSALHVPLKYNIRPIYRASEEGISTDLKISPMAAYFLTIHLDPINPIAAKLQFYFASKYKS